MRGLLCFGADIQGSDAGGVTLEEYDEVGVRLGYAGPVPCDVDVQVEAAHARAGEPKACLADGLALLFGAHRES